LGTIFGLIAFSILQDFSLVVLVIILTTLSLLAFGLSKLFFYAVRGDIKIRSFPNQGVKAAVKNSIMLLPLICFTGVLFIFSLSMKMLWLSTVFLIILILIYGVFLDSLSGCAQHFILRLVLWQNGAIPWNYAKFLQYTSELRLTRQTGGEFRFFHDLLREHFAQSPPPAP